MAKVVDLRFFCISLHVLIGVGSHCQGWTMPPWLQNPFIFIILKWSKLTPWPAKRRLWAPFPVEKFHAKISACAPYTYSGFDWETLMMSCFSTWLVIHSAKTGLTVQSGEWVFVSTRFNFAICVAMSDKCSVAVCCRLLLHLPFFNSCLVEL